MEKLRITVLIIFLFSIINPYDSLFAQQDHLNNLDSLIEKIDETFAETNQTHLEIIQRIVQSFYEAYPGNKKFIDCLYSIDCSIEYGSILNYNDLKTNASMQPNQVVSITTPLLSQLLDDALFCTKILASYYVDLPATNISYDAIEKYQFDTHGTILAWVIAHEIAHAYLEHNVPGNECYKPSKLEKSRFCELEADLFSFDILNQSGYSLIVLLSYFDLKKRLEDIQTEMGNGKEETYSSHPNFNTRSAVLMHYILNSKTFKSSIFMFSTFIPGNTWDEPSKMSFLLPDESYCHNGYILKDDQLFIVAFEYMSDGSAWIYEKNDAENIVYRISDIYAHECDLQITGHSVNNNLDVNIKVYRDSFKGIFVQFDSDIINKFINISTDDFYREVILEYSQNEEVIYQATRSITTMYATTQDLYLQYQKGEISMTIYTEGYMQAKQSLIKEMQGFFTEDQVNSLLPAVGVF